MSRFRTEEELADEERPATSFSGSGFLGSLRGRSKSVTEPGTQSSEIPDDGRNPMHPVPLTEIVTPNQKSQAATMAYYGQNDGAEHVYGLPSGLRSQNTAYEGIRWSDQVSDNTGDLADRPASRNISSPHSFAPTPPPHSAKRQFSFQNVFKKHQDHDDSPSIKSPRRSMGSRQLSHKHLAGATEEERLGLVKGDSHTLPKLPPYAEGDEDWVLEGKDSLSSGSTSEKRGSDELEDYEEHRRKWNQNRGDSPGPPTPPRMGGSGDTGRNAFL